MAFAAARPDARFDRWVALFLVWFGVFGLIGVSGQLWQRYVPDDVGEYILIDPVFSSVTLASELLLLFAGLSLIGARRATTR